MGREDRTTNRRPDVVASAATTDRHALAATLTEDLEAVRACGDAHRIGDRMRAAEQLIALSDRLSTLHAGLLTTARAQPALVAYAALLSALLRDLGSAQASRDGVRIADLLEYEGLPLLTRCQAALST
jgi:hypothetical protein